MIWIVDRIEGEYAVVEYGEEFYDVPLELLPGISEGDIVDIEITDGSERKREMESKLTRLFNKKK